VEYYAKIVRECAVRRNLIRLSNEVVARSHDESIESSQILDEAQKKLFEITEHRQSVAYKSVKELLPETISTIERYYKTKSAYTGIPSGFSELDTMTSGFQNSEFVVIGARPSMGKTALALSMAGHMTIKEKIPIGFFSLEMADMAIMQRIVSSEAKISSTQIRQGFIKPSDFQNLMDAAGRIYEAPLYIVDEPNMKLLDLRTMARRMHSECGIKAVFIDYLTLVTHENADMPRWEQISSISRSLKALARELRIPVIALSQLKREAEGKQPTLSDLRESGSIEQDADLILFLHRDREINKSKDEQSTMIETELIVAKQRNGPVGTAKIAFIPNYTSFVQLDSRSHQ
jgi:replicative DNA helicase